MNQIVIITGLSGSGKSTALNAFEDLDYYAVDNLPIKLLDKFLELLLAGTSEIHKIAIVMDLRDHEFLNNYQQVFEQVQRQHPQIEILFLYANEDILIRRFSETRRKHPLSTKNVDEGIKKEIELLSSLKDIAINTLDTSSMNVHQLKKRITDQYGTPDSTQLQMRFVSFGYKYGLPKNCDLILDVRFLTNPHFVSNLRSKTGLDLDVQEYIKNDSRYSEFIKKTLSYLSFLIPHYATEGRKYLSIGIGCTGGRHRSVFIAETLADRLPRELSFPIRCQVEHQDISSTEERLAGLRH